MLLKSGAWMLATQKPINRPVRWKGKFISDAGNWWVGWTSVQRPTSPADKQGVRALQMEGGATRRTSTASSDSHLQIGHWWSDRHHLVCCRYS